MITRANAKADSTFARRGGPATVREFCRILYRHKGKMGVSFTCTLAAVVTAALLLPRTFTSESRVLVRLGHESVSLDPTATLNQTVNFNESRESEINSELEILRSRTLYEQVVKELGTNEILGEEIDPDSWKATLQQPIAWARRLVNGVDLDRHERAVQRLAKKIGVAAPRRSNMIVVTCEAGDPAQAQRILQAFLDQYHRMHTTANKTHGSHGFFVDQAELMRVQLDDAQNNLRQYKNEIQLASVEGQRTNVEAQMNSIETAILDNQRAMTGSEARVKALQEKLAALPHQLVAEETDRPNEGADLLRNELYKVQILEKELSSRFTADHPLVIAAQHQVRETERVFSGEQPRRVETVRGPSTVHQGVQTDLAAAEATLAAEKAQGEQLNAQYKTVQAKVRALNDSEVKVAELERKAELAEAGYKSYTTNRELTRIREALADGRISNISPVQPATFVAKPTGPKNLLILAGGFALAVFGSLLLALVAEYLDPSLRTPAQIEEQLELPVLLAVPRRSGHELLTN